MNKSLPKNLDLSLLSGGFPQIEASYCAALGSAAAVALEEEGHSSGVRMTINGDYSDQLAVLWTPVTDQARNTYADPDEATEFGACAIAFLLCRELLDFTIIQRSRRGTGFDYWIGQDGDLPFQNQARLEVSGIRKGTEGQISRRVRQKISQTTPSSGTFPAIVIVVEFSSPRTQVVAA
jgi:hypothetical protein